MCKYFKVAFLFLNWEQMLPVQNTTCHWEERSDEAIYIMNRLTLTLSDEIASPSDEAKASRNGLAMTLRRTQNLRLRT